MKRHVVKTLLLMSLVVSSVWSFVGCKDYDEDAYGDLKSRITKETTLREALQLQVDELEGLVKSLETCKCDLSNYLTQQQGDDRYVKISDYEGAVYQISANKTAIELINNAINEIKLKLATVDLHQERIDYIVGKMSDMNDLISEVKATADEALLLAKEAKCTCNFADLENRLKTLEGYIAGWDEQLAKVSVKTDEALARAISDSIMIVKLRKTVDSLSTVVTNVQNNTLTSIISSIQNLQNNTYTKEQIDEIIRNLPIGQTADLTPILERISTIENNYYTKEQIEALIKAVPVVDLSDIIRRLEAIEGKPTVDAYTKAEVDMLLRNLVFPQTDLTQIESRLNDLEGRMFWTRQQIVDLINQYMPTPVNLSEIERRLTELENRPTIDSYTKAEVRELINNLYIPDVTGIIADLRNIKNTYLTEQQIINLIKKYAPSYDMNSILARLAALECNTYTKDEVKLLIAKINVPDVSSLIRRVDALESNKHWTLDELISLIRNYAPQSTYDDTDILRRLLILETRNVYTKDEVNELIRNLNIPNLQPILDRLKALEDKQSWTADDIIKLIEANAYDDTEVLERLLALENRDSYTKSEVDALINNLNIPNVKPILDRLKALEDNKHWTLTEIITLIKTYAPQTISTTEYNAILWRLMALEANTYSKQEVINLINGLQIPNVQSILDRLSQLENNAWTPEKIIALIKSVSPSSYDDTAIWKKLLELEGKINYNKTSLLALIASLNIPELEDRIEDLEQNSWTKDQIVALIKKYAPTYDDSMILARLYVLEHNTYTKDQVNWFIHNLNITDYNLDARLRALENSQGQGGGLTTQQVIDLIGQYGCKCSGVLDDLKNKFDNYYTKNEIDGKLSDIGFAPEQKEAILNIINDFLTIDQIIALIKEQAPAFDATEIWNALNNRYTKEQVYTKAEVENLIKGIIAAGTGSTPENIPGGIAELTTVFDNIKNKLNSLPESFLTEARVNELITAAIGEIPSAYNDKWLRDMLEEGEGGNIFTTKKYVDGLIQTLRNEANAIKETADTALGQANTALGQANTNKTAIEGLNTRVGDLETKMTQVLGDISSLKTSVGTLQTTVGTLRTDLDALEDRVDDLKDAVETITGQITQINNDITSLKNRMDAAEQDIKNLKDDIQAMITDITVQGTQSPIIGYFNTPFDVRSTLLGVYFGTPMHEWEFPSTDGADYVHSEDVNKWTRRNINILGSDKFGTENGYAGINLVTRDGATGNAGTLYVTVNPASVDFTGKTLKLEDSQQGEASAKLSPLAASNRLLNFGYTRASGNGFYEAKATIGKNDIDKSKFEIDFDALQEEAKAVLNDRSKSSVLELGSTLIRNFQAQLPAYAAMGSWTDKSSVDKIEHKIYSQYNIGSVAVRPLPFTFMQDVTISKFPGIDWLESLAGDIVKKIRLDMKTDLPDFSKYAGSITFTDFSVPNLDWSKFHVKYQRTFTIEDFEKYIKTYFGTGISFDAGRNGKIYLVFDKENNEYVLEVEQTYNDGSKRYSTFRYNKNTGKFTQDGREIANAHFPLEIEAVIDIDKEEDAKAIMNQLLAAVNEKVGANGEISKQVTDLLNDIASMGNLNDAISASLLTTQTDIKSVLDRYITHLNNRLTNLVNLSPSLLHLALIANANNKVSVLSQSKDNPTSAVGISELTLYPTTYTLELLAPAYKKFVAVTDVFNADGTNASNYVSLGQAANNNGTNLAQVIEGDALCTLKNPQANHIYEITYTAIDYFGWVSIKKYYVRF